MTQILFSFKRNVFGTAFCEKAVYIKLNHIIN
jgi:hypothetical protein